MSRNLDQCSRLSPGLGGEVSDSEVDVNSLRSLVLGGLCTVSITFKGGKFPLHPFGLVEEDYSGVLSAPEGVVAEGVTVAIHYAILLSGPFCLPENWQRVSVVLHLDCPKRSWLLKPIELRLKHWAVLAEGTIISVMKAPHILLPNETNFAFEEIQHKRVFSDVVSLSMQEDFCLICSAAKPSGPREVDIKCFGMLIPTPMEDRVQNLFLCCTFADTAWISAMELYYRFIESGKRCPKPREFIFTGNAIEARVRDVKGPGWTVTVVKREVFKEELSSIDECTQCDKKIARMTVGLYPPSMDFVVTYEKTPSEKTHCPLANIVELVAATSRDQAASFCFHVHSRMDPTDGRPESSPSHGHTVMSPTARCFDNSPSDAALQRVLQEIGGYWRVVAILLGVPAQHVGPEDSSPLTAFLYWRNSSSESLLPPTWKSLFDAVRNTPQLGPRMVERLKTSVSQDSRLTE